jgi:omega-amidase
MKSINLNISAIQCDLHWEDVEQNLQSIEYLLTTVPVNADVVLLPEMFTSGFSMDAKSVAVKMEGAEVNRIKTWASKYNVAIVGSLAVEENGNYYNRLLWVNPDGEVFKYDKKHLFTFANEQKTYCAGNEKLIVCYKGLKFACFICYDLRFPVWNRNAGNDYDVAIYVANWPEKRIEAWKSLLVARAIENQAYVVAVNRVGTDGNGVKYNGYSVILGPEGEALVVSEVGEKKTLNCSLSGDRLNKYRIDFPVFNDADKFKIR